MKILMTLVITSLLSMNLWAKTNTPSNATSDSKKSTSAPLTTYSREPSSSSSSFPKNIFESNGRSELFFSFTDALISSGGGITNISINGMYTYLIADQFQVGGEVGIFSGKDSGGNSYTSTVIYALGMFNFNKEINESPFVFAALGVHNGKDVTGTSSSNSAVKVGGGMRFPIFAHLQYAPMAWIEKIADNDPVLNLMPVNFSLIF